jgi:preprotein translocase subunit Sss1
MRNHVDGMGIFLVYVIGFIIGLIVIRFFKQRGK